MLKVYDVTKLVSIDGAAWYEIGGGYKVANEKPENNLILYNASFDEVRDYLSNNHLAGIWNDNTFFLKKPTIKIQSRYGWDSVEYRRFKTLSYQIKYKEWTNVSLDWIIKNLSADECIQYLKERGMTTCPILK